MGEGEFEARESPFQSMNAVERIKAKLRDWERRRRGLKAEEEKEESILGVGCEVVPVQVNEWWSWLFDLARRYYCCGGGEFRAGEGDCFDGSFSSC